MIDSGALLTQPLAAKADTGANKQKALRLSSRCFVIGRKVKVDGHVAGLALEVEYRSGRDSRMYYINYTWPY